MDDIGKAIVMISHVLLFAVACTVSIMLYSTITNQIDSVMLAKDYSNRGDSITGIDKDTIGKVREVAPAEVVLAILDLKEKAEGNEVIVNGTTYFYSSGDDKIKTTSGASWNYTDDANNGGILNPTSFYRQVAIGILRDPNKYRLTYNEDTLIYRND